MTERLGTAPEIHKSEITLGKLLGEGSFGAVYTGVCRNVPVAVKILNPDIEMDTDELENFKSEVSIMVHLRHPNILLLLGACYDPGELMIVTELMKCDLGQLIYDKKVTLSWMDKIKLCKDVLNGLAWLHQSNPPILHRDVKPGNILVDENNTAKLCDFGVSCIQVSEKIRDEDYPKGSILWMSPEVLSGGDVDESCDIYAFSIVLWELMEEKSPVEYLVVDKKPPLREDMTESLKNLISNGWSPVVEERPNATKFLAALDTVLLDLCIPQEEGKKLWLDYFEKPSIPFPEFAKVLYEHLSIDFPQYPSFDETYGCLEMFFANDVTVEAFGNFITWFGPMDQELINRLEAIIRAPWFFGDISKEEAQTKLGEHYGESMFLIRLSSRDADSYPFVLSHVLVSEDDEKYVHYRIKRVQSNLRILFKVNDKTVKIQKPDLSSIVNEIVKPMKLGKPCRGRKYNFDQKIGSYFIESEETEDS